MRTLQESLLPEAIPTVAGVAVAARHLAAHDGVGSLGDFYDVFESALGSWHVVIGDVCGHGVPAAKTTALARWTLESEANRTSDPVELLRALNTAVCRQSSSRFLSAQVLTLTRTADGLDVELASGGHPAPVVVHGDGSVAPVAVRGSLVGVFPEIELERTRVRLGPGDVLVLATDGLAEARRDLEFLGEQAVLDCLAEAGRTPDAIVDALVQLVVDWSRPNLRDDVAVLALGPEDRPTGG